MVLAGLLVLGGCAGDAPSSTVRVLVQDGNLRRLGEPCNGAGPFRYAHAEAGYVVRDSAGAEVFRGELPNGTAERMLDVDFREGLRQPTMCVMTLRVDGVAEPEGHELVIDDQEGLPIEPDGKVTVS